MVQACFFLSQTDFECGVDCEKWVILFHMLTVYAVIGITLWLWMGENICWMWKVYGGYDRKHTVIWYWFERGRHIQFNTLTDEIMTGITQWLWIGLSVGQTVDECEKSMMQTIWCVDRLVFAWCGAW